MIESAVNFQTTDEHGFAHVNCIRVHPWFIAFRLRVEHVIRGFSCFSWANPRAFLALHFVRLLFCPIAIQNETMPELSLSKSVLLTDYGLCVNRYRLFTPGIYVCFHVPVILDDNTRIVPGLVAQVNHGRLKQCEATEDGFIGPPNFIFDVFDADELDEYESRKSSFEKHGVSEYVVLIADENQTCHWNCLLYTSDAADE